MDEAARRKAENEKVFRDANEKIHDAALEILPEPGPTPFLCECSDVDCREVLLLMIAEYEFARADASRFILADGHPHGEAELLRSGDGYGIWAKAGVPE
jgi:hypothetical protein